MWVPLLVILGYSRVHLFGKEFLSAPIHSPLSGRLIGPSILVSEPATDLRDFNQSKIQIWRNKNGVQVLHTLME
jgi:hypothetical protein